MANQEKKKEQSNSMEIKFKSQMDNLWPTI